MSTKVMFTSFSSNNGAPSSSVNNFGGITNPYLSRTILRLLHWQAGGPWSPGGPFLPGSPRGPGKPLGPGLPAGPILPVTPSAPL